MVSIPNPYLGDYKRLAIFPIALILISLFFIPQIKLGVDFRGGTLIRLGAIGDPSADVIQTALVDGGLAVTSIKVLDDPVNASAKIVEIELEQDEELLAADTAKTVFFSKIDDVSRLEADADTGAEGAADAYAKAKVDIDASADIIFNAAGLDTKASDIKQTNELSKAVAAASAKMRDDRKASLISLLGDSSPYTSISFDEVSASLSSKFIERAGTTMLIAAVFVTIAVFLFFRTIVPSIAVLVGALADVIIALGAMGLFGIPFSLASFAAILMLIGFSLDTDVLLTMRVIKRKEGTAAERAFDAFKTGATMSVAALAAFIVLFVLGSITHISTYYEIAAVAICGLVGDLFATWGINAIIILHYAQSREKNGRLIEEKPIFKSIFEG
jgi:preprotein translocase subunit SecF